MCGPNSNCVSFDAPRHWKSLKGSTQCMRGPSFAFPIFYFIFYGIVSDLPVECEKSIFWMHFYLSLTSMAVKVWGSGAWSAIGVVMTNVFNYFRLVLLTVPKMRQTTSTSIWDLSHIIVTEHSVSSVNWWQVKVAPASGECGDFCDSQIVGTHRALSNNAKLNIVLSPSR